MLDPKPMAVLLLEELGAYLVDGREVYEDNGTEYWVPFNSVAHFLHYEYTLHMMRLIDPVEDEDRDNSASWPLPRWHSELAIVCDHHAFRLAEYTDCDTGNFCSECYDEHAPNCPDCRALELEYA